jgi:hypothetical protein
MTSHDQLINKIANQFKKKLTKDVDHSEVSNIFRSVLVEHENELLGKRKAKKKTSEGPKKSNWQAIWTSNSNGCRAYPEFKGELESIVKKNPEMDRFSINKQLREWANENNKYEGWKTWAAARLESEGKAVPQDKSTDSKISTNTKDDSKSEKLQEPAENKVVPKDVIMTKKAEPRAGRKKTAAK